jgi:hypothetical protein
VNELTDNDVQNTWEVSGFHEGDIVGFDHRNGLIGDEFRWPYAVVPYYIEDDEFSSADELVIMRALEEYHNRTCIKFRPFKRGDENFVWFRSNSSGCWSSVGMQPGEGQIVHLQNPGCIRHGTVVHELMHALGFYHQQSTSDRDDYVKIVWENIEPNHEHNFNKYNESVVTSYGVDYDYGSVMHYSAKAFSKNGEDTILSLTPNTTLGQRKGLSDRDVQKLQLMYEAECERQGNLVEPTGSESNGFKDQLLALLETLGLV